MVAASKTTPVSMLEISDAKDMDSRLRKLLALTDQYIFGRQISIVSRGANDDGDDDKSGTTKRPRRQVVDDGAEEEEIEGEDL